jgi:hypothetical protein
LAGGEAAAIATAATEQEIAGTLPGGKVLVDSMARLLGSLEPDRNTGLVLPHDRTVDRIAMWRDVLNLHWSTAAH